MHHLHAGLQSPSQPEPPAPSPKPWGQAPVPQQPLLPHSTLQPLAGPPSQFLLSRWDHQHGAPQAPGSWQGADDSWPAHESPGCKCVPEPGLLGPDTIPVEAALEACLSLPPHEPDLGPLARAAPRACVPERRDAGSYSGLKPGRELGRLRGAPGAVEGWPGGANSWPHICRGHSTASSRLGGQLTGSWCVPALPVQSHLTHPSLP